MSYVLTLTHGERQAIDWVGDRYSCGDDLSSLLWGVNSNGVESDPPHANWDDARSITFFIPEAIAWDIRDLIERDGLPCFAPEFSEKLYDFASKVV